MPYKDIDNRRASNKRSYEKNKKRWVSTRREYLEQNKEKLKLYYSDYQKSHQKLLNERTRNRMKNDPEYREKINKRQKLWREKNKEKMALMKKKSVLKHQYGLTLEEYQTLLENQDNKCAICSRNSVKLCVDHDHKTGKTRGLLCHACNRAIGLLKENIDILENAIKYVNKHKT